MINDIIKVVQLISDRDRWLQLSQLIGHISSKHNDWQKEIRCAKASFSCNEHFKVRAFLNKLVQDIRGSGVCEEQANNFTRVFNELLDNSFRHACGQNPKGRVQIVCFYCRWFIHLEVKDAGKGFDLSKELMRARASSKERAIAHGLQVVDSLAYELYNKDNSVSVVLNGQQSFEVIPVLESFKGQEILHITVLSDDAWYDMIIDWTPLLKLIENAKQHLFLIDLTEVSWPSRSIIYAVEEVTDEAQRRQSTDRITHYPDRQGAKFAFLINRGAHSSFGLTRYEDDARPPIFKADQELEAKRWLVES